MTREAARLLVVEDSASMRLLLHRLLDHLGFHTVDEAEDGLVALEKLHVGLYHLVISDWYMPRMTGIELLKVIRSTPELRRLPVVLVMGYITRALILEATAAGADAFLEKPWVDVTLAEKVTRLLESGAGHPPLARLGLAAATAGARH